MDSDVLLKESHRLSVSVIAEALDAVDIRQIGEALDKSVLPSCTEVSFS